MAVQAYARVATAKTAPHTPKPSVAMIPIRTPVVGRTRVARSARTSPEVVTTPTNTTTAAAACAGLRRSPRNTTTSSTVTATYDATTGATTATGPRASAR